jgi:hypothetical protein
MRLIVSEKNFFLWKEIFKATEVYQEINALSINSIE